MFPKIGTPKLDGENFMENPMNKWMIWGFSHIFWFNTHFVRPGNSASAGDLFWDGENVTFWKGYITRDLQLGDEKVTLNQLFFFSVDHFARSGRFWRHNSKHLIATKQAHLFPRKNKETT